MDPDMAELENRSIKEYAQIISAMGGSRGYKGTAIPIVERGRIQLLISTVSYV